MKRGDCISLTKINSINTSDGVLIENYNLKGYLFRDIQLGEKIMVGRFERNGLEVIGVFESTPIEQIDGNILTTKNSKWKIENILTGEE